MRFGGRLTRHRLAGGCARRCPRRRPGRHVHGRRQPGRYRVRDAHRDGAFPGRDRVSRHGHAECPGPGDLDHRGFARRPACHQVHRRRRRPPPVAQGQDALAADRPRQLLLDQQAGVGAARRFAQRPGDAPRRQAGDDHKLVAVEALHPGAAAQPRAAIRAVQQLHLVGVGAGQGCPCHRRGPCGAGPPESADRSVNDTRVSLQPPGRAAQGRGGGALQQ
jgi:hypothetical protein